MLHQLQSFTDVVGTAGLTRAAFVFFTLSACAGWYGAVLGHRADKKLDRFLEQQQQQIETFAAETDTPSDAG